MASLDLPSSSKELSQKSRTDFKRNVPESNPDLRNSYIGAMLTAMSQRVFEFYVTLAQAIKQAFPNTATGDFLTDHLDIWQVSKNPAIGSTGNIVFTGTVASVISIGDLVQNSSNRLYSVTLGATITVNVLAVSGITRAGAVATVTMVLPHNFTSLIAITIAGADQGEYNGVFAIIPINTTQFTFTVAVAAVTPATGAITATGTFAVAEVISLDQDKDTVLAPDEQVTLTNPLAGVTSTAATDQDAVVGGSDVETDAEVRVRLLERIGNPVTNFNIGQIQFEARQVPGVTRVFIFPASDGGSPTEGFAEVFFVRDNDGDGTAILPTGDNLTNVQAVINAIIPVDMEPANLTIAAPVGVIVDFIFSSLVPNTATMRDGITGSLQQFFRDVATVGQNLDQDAMEAAIFNTVDTQTGDKVQSFALSSPGAGTVILAGELGLLGTISFP